MQPPTDKTQKNKIDAYIRTIEHSALRPLNDRDLFGNEPTTSAGLSTNKRFLEEINASSYSTIEDNAPILTDEAEDVSTQEKLAEIEKKRSVAYEILTNTHHKLNKKDDKIKNSTTSNKSSSSNGKDNDNISGKDKSIENFAKVPKKSNGIDEVNDNNLIQIFLKEKLDNKLDITLKIKKKLEKQGYRNDETTTNDVDLNTKLENKAKLLKENQLNKLTTEEEQRGANTKTLSPHDTTIINPEKPTPVTKKPKTERPQNILEAEKSQLKQLSLNNMNDTNISPNYTTDDFKTKVIKRSKKDTVNEHKLKMETLPTKEEEDKMTQKNGFEDDAVNMESVDKNKKPIDIQNELETKSGKRLSKTEDEPKVEIQQTNVIEVHVNNELEHKPRKKSSKKLKENYSGQKNQAAENTSSEENVIHIYKNEDAETKPVKKLKKDILRVKTQLEEEVKNNTLQKNTVKNTTESNTSIGSDTRIHFKDYLAKKSTTNTFKQLKEKISKKLLKKYKSQLQVKVATQFGSPSTAEAEINQKKNVKQLERDTSKNAIQSEDAKPLKFPSIHSEEQPLAVAQEPVDNCKAPCFCNHNGVNFLIITPKSMEKSRKFYLLNTQRSSPNGSDASRYENQTPKLNVSGDSKKFTLTAYESVLNVLVEKNNHDRSLKWEKSASSHSITIISQSSVTFDIDVVKQACKHQEYRKSSSSSSGSTYFNGPKKKMLPKLKISEFSFIFNLITLQRSNYHCTDRNNKHSHSTILLKTDSSSESIKLVPKPHMSKPLNVLIKDKEYHTSDYLLNNWKISRQQSKRAKNRLNVHTKLCKEKSVTKLKNEVPSLYYLNLTYIRSSQTKMDANSECSRYGSKLI
ncbi:hypothetical protein FQA39_LY04251 [Lamprigera yunnana]|nr:hypothetical protein FQA39_LY04251 [Lamprigera yunnana]